MKQGFVRGHRAKIFRVSSYVSDFTVDQKVLDEVIKPLLASRKIENYKDSGIYYEHQVIGGINMDIDFKGYNENVVTFLADETVTAGKFVVMSDNNFKVTAAGSGDEIFGYCISVRDGYAAVQMSGYIEVPHAGKIGLGLVGLVTNRGLSVMENPTAIKHRVIFVDDTTIGFMI
jgi:hypothetical protein